MQTVRFGLIGCGLMGREFASAAARWCHLTESPARPELVAICNRTLTPEKIGWFRAHFASIRQVTSDYRELLANPDVDAVYAAVPHDLHEEVYVAALDAGKHLLGEKPFGIDRRAGEAILAAVRRHPDRRVGCASQYVFHPGVQRILRMAAAGEFGPIIEVNSGFFHSSDLNPSKPINWKRVARHNGEYGSLGDLGTHVALVPLRLGWVPEDTRAVCQNLVPQRPDATGRLVPCDTWDNATLLTRLRDPGGDAFPWTLKVHRIMPGEMNTWFLGIYGTKACAKFSLKNPRQLKVLHYRDGEQAWRRIDLGCDPPYKTISGGIFEFGASDAIMQMIAAFLYEVAHGAPLSRWAACPTPEEALGCHRLFTAALESNRTGQTVRV